MFDWIRSGLRTGTRRRRLVLAFYLTSLLPALFWTLAAWPVLSGALGDRPLADGLLGAKSFQVWAEFAANEGPSLTALSGLLPLLLGLTVLAQILVTAGGMNILLRSGLEGSFFVGMRRFTGRFVRSLLAFGLLLIPALMVFGLGSRIGGRLAESTGNGNFRLGFLGAALALAFLLFLLADLAYDLSRISAVAKDGRQTFRGVFRALAAILRRPGRLVALYLAFTLLVVGIVALYQLLRGSFGAANGVTIFAAFLLQQLSMLARAYLQVSFLGGEVAAYRSLTSPDWCRGEPRRPRVEELPEKRFPPPPEDVIPGS